MEIREIAAALRSGWITTGPRTERFENAVARAVHAKHAVACSSCTDALHIALTALDVGPGDEVILPVLTFTATAHAVLYRGARPVFADIAPETMNVSVRDIERRITRRTKVILPVHYGGNPCDMDSIRRLARKCGAHVVEDAAHAIGARYRGRPIGSLSDMTCFSFYATKNITTAEGGMITTNNKIWAERAKRLTMYGISDARRIWGERFKPKGTWDYDVTELGYKANMPDVLAAIGIHQLRRLGQFTKTRRRYAHIYMERLSGIPGIAFQKTEPKSFHCRHLFPVILPPSVDRNELIVRLKSAGIGASVLWRPLHLHTFFRQRLKTKKGDYPNAEKVFQHLINLPISPAISERQIKKIADTVLTLVREKYDPFGFTGIKAGVSYVRAVRRQSRRKSDTEFLKEIREKRMS